jgi:threonylcarbamoyladenosine tRNA methylthiotransferase MtaB
VLRELSTRKKTAFYRTFVGRTVHVLFERQEASGWYTGFSDNYVKVGVATDTDIANQILPVQLHDVANGMATGVLHTSL